jgi:hypothetical protein
VSSESFFFLSFFYFSSLLVIYKEIGEKKKKKDNNSVDILKLWWIQYQYCWKYLNKINSTTPKNITNGKRSGLHKSSKGVEVTCLQAAYIIHFDYYWWPFFILLDLFRRNLLNFTGFVIIGASIYLWNLFISLFIKFYI